MARSSRASTTKTTTRTIGTITRLSRAAEARRSRSCGGRAPDQRRLSAGALDDAPQVEHGIEGLVAVGVGLQRDVELHARLAALRRADEGDRGRRWTSRTASARSRRARRRSTARCCRPGSLGSSRSCPSTDSTESRKPFLLVSPELRSQPEARMASSTPAPPHTRRGRSATRSPTRRHTPCVSSAPVSPKRGTKGQKARRPVMASRAGRTREHRDHGQPHADRPDRTQAAGAVDLGERQAEQRRDDSQPGGDDGGARPAQRHGDRLVLRSWRRSSSRYRATRSRA